MQRRPFAQKIRYVCYVCPVCFYVCYVLLPDIATVKSSCGHSVVHDINHEDFVVHLNVMDGDTLYDFEGQIFTSEEAAMNFIDDDMVQDALDETRN